MGRGADLLTRPTVASHLASRRLPLGLARPKVEKIIPNSAAMAAGAGVGRSNASRRPSPSSAHHMEETAVCVSTVGEES